MHKPKPLRQSQQELKRGPTVLQPKDEQKQHILKPKEQQQTMVVLIPRKQQQQQPQGTLQQQQQQSQGTLRQHLTADDPDFDEDDPVDPST